MMTAKKGAILQAKVIGLILLIVAAAIVIGFVVTEYIVGRTAIDKQDCYNTVVARNNVLARGEIVQTELIPLRCQTEDIDIKSTDETEIKKTIANSMYECWWMLGQGKMTFLKDDAYLRFTQNDVNSEKIACVLCSTITFDEKVKKDNISLDMMEYLQDNQIVLKNMTYLDYFLNSENSKLQVVDNQADSNEINTGQDYAVVYFSIKGGNIGNEILRNAMPSIIWGGIYGAIGPVGAFLQIRSLFSGDSRAWDYLKRIKIASVYCDKGLKGCNILMLIPQTEQAFSVCRQFANIP